MKTLLASLFLLSAASLFGAATHPKIGTREVTTRTESLSVSNALRTQLQAYTDSQIVALVQYPPFNDDVFEPPHFFNDTDPTKKIRFNLGNLAAGTTNILYPPAASGTLALIGISNAWTRAQTIVATTDNGNVPILSLVPTWTDAALATGLYMNITDTSSHSSSRIVDLNLGLARFRLGKYGNVLVSGESSTQIAEPAMLVVNYLGDVTGVLSAEPNFKVGTNGVYNFTVNRKGDVAAAGSLSASNITGSGSLALSGSIIAGGMITVGGNGVEAPVLYVPGGGYINGNGMQIDSAGYLAWSQDSTSIDDNIGAMISSPSFGNLTLKTNVLIPGTLTVAGSRVITLASFTNSSGIFTNNFTVVTNGTNANLAFTIASAIDGVIPFIGAAGLMTSEELSWSDALNVLTVEGRVIADTLTVGSGGGTITAMLTASLGIDFPSTSLGAVFDAPITVAGAASGDIVEVGPPQPSITGIIGSYSGFASNGVAYVRFTPTANNQDPVNGTFKVIVKKF